MNLTATNGASSGQATKGLVVTPGPDFLRMRADGSSSGGFGNEGISAVVTVMKNPRQ
jgi:hypothetical protein